MMIMVVWQSTNACGRARIQICGNFTRSNSKQTRKRQQCESQNYHSMTFYGKKEENIRWGKTTPPLRPTEKAILPFVPRPRIENKGEIAIWKNFWGRNMRFLMREEKLGKEDSTSLNRHCFPHFFFHEVAIMLRWNAMSRDLRILKQEAKKHCLT